MKYSSIIMNEYYQNIISVETSCEVEESVFTYKSQKGTGVTLQKLYIYIYYSKGCVELQYALKLPS